jgi:isoleucyl-tRNA synthetase
VVDEEGRKMSKSAGNFVGVQDVLKNFGADVTRLWISSIDYRNDIMTSPETIGRAAEAYKKLRYTLRYLLGNVGGFVPKNDAVDADDLLEIDRWALAQLQLLVGRVRHAYDEFDFHMVYQRLYNFCAVQMSAFYFDVLKDRRAQRADRAERNPSRPAAPRRARACPHLRGGVGTHAGSQGIRERPPDTHAAGVRGIPRRCPHRALQPALHRAR